MNMGNPKYNPHPSAPFPGDALLASPFGRPSGRREAGRIGSCAGGRTMKPHPASRIRLARLAFVGGAVLAFAFLSPAQAQMPAPTPVPAAAPVLPSTNQGQAPDVTPGMYKRR